MCTSGSISVTTNNGITVNVNAGYKTNVSTGVPTTPSAITSSAIDNIEDTNSKENKSEDIQDKASQAQDGTNSNLEDSTTATMTGYSVTADGTTEAISSEIKEIGGVSLPTNSSLVVTDDAGIVTDSLQSEVITWGHWVYTYDKNTIDLFFKYSF